MTRKLTIDAPKDIDDWVLKDIASGVRDTIESLSDYEAGKVTMRRGEFSTTLTIELEKA